VDEEEDGLFTVSEIWAPKKDLCGNGPGPARGGFWHHGPPNSKIKIGPRGPPKIERPLFVGPFWDSRSNQQQHAATHNTQEASRQAETTTRTSVVIGV
jgi:hypothetical protein